MVQERGWDESGNVTQQHRRIILRVIRHKFLKQRNPISKHITHEPINGGELNGENETATQATLQYHNETHRQHNLQSNSTFQHNKQRNT